MIPAPATDTDADPDTSAAALAQYSFRRSAFEQEGTTRFTRTGWITGQVPTPVVHDLAIVHKIHLKYDRTNPGAQYRCLVDAPHRRRLSIVTRHWGGVGTVDPAHPPANVPP